ncbi:beta-galactosidase [Agromyces sp. ZXT2-6]|uniref:beta-galactosidase n=1 Tax=Agromyces sp. ZXT2-6 TaxID=3461153 RepID=UPI0040550EAB
MSDTVSPAPRPWAFSAEAPFALLRAGAPALLVGGQVFNSASSSPKAIVDSFAHVRRVGSNVVLSPVSWAISEPAEGAFDFTLVDVMLAEARRNDLRLVLLWFGAFKNAASTYAPTWVRGNPERFPRAVVEPKGMQAFTYEGATAKPVLSVFSPELREADAKAFEALVRHLVDADPDGTVVMVQVENESGILSDSRDRNALAEAAWAAPVPSELVAHVRATPAGSTSARSLWDANGSAESGSWSQVFGDTPAAEEVFMAWAIATYVEHLAARGQAIADIPMYANAWLGPQPGQDTPGQYPSGGPASTVLDVWRAAAPSLSFLGPDIYVRDADAAMKQYSTGIQPFFVPESQLRAAELVRAIGAYGAVGWSAYGLDAANPDGQLSATITFIPGLEDEIAAAALRGSLRAVVLEPGIGLENRSIDGIDITARGARALLQRMLLDVGVSIPDTELAVPDETVPHAQIAAPGETRPFALIAGTGDDGFLVIGRAHPGLLRRRCPDRDRFGAGAARRRRRGRPGPRAER